MELAPIDCGHIASKLLASGGREVEFYLDVVEELLARGEKEKKNCAVSYCVVKLGIVARRRTDGRLL